jgi:hypothetical protein
VPDRSFGDPFRVAALLRRLIGISLQFAVVARWTGPGMDLNKQPKHPLSVSIVLVVAWLFFLLSGLRACRLISCCLPDGMAPTIGGKCQVRRALILVFSVPGDLVGNVAYSGVCLPHLIE